MYNKIIGTGTRETPLCFAYHKTYGYVPVIKFEKHGVVWDDGQITRSDPPYPAYELSEYSDFDLRVHIYVKELIKDME